MHVAIIGNGISGITAARHIRKLDASSRITVISSETDHFFSRTALMYIYMGHMKYEHTKPYEDWFWSKNRIDLTRARIKSIDSSAKKLITDTDTEITYDKLLIATGSKSNKFGWPGQDLDGVQGLYNYQDLENLERLTKGGQVKRAVIVGGGLIGIELAEMLHSRHIPVTFLIRETSFWNNVLPNGESEMVNREILRHGFKLKKSTELKEIVDDGTGRATAVITSEGERIDCQFVGLTAGVSPNIDFLEGSGIETQRGVLVNSRQQTNVDNIYAAGDCTQLREPPPGRRPVEQVWYTGRMQGETAARNICGIATDYNPGYWFNSAKFLSLEYQTYGTVLPHLPETQQSLYWEHPDGDKCVHLVYQKSDKLFIGMNSFGIRYRHRIFDKFLRDGRDIEFVLQNLGSANFDPEFFTQYEADIISEYNRQSGAGLRLKNRRGLKGVFQLLGN